MDERRGTSDEGLVTWVVRRSTKKRWTEDGRRTVDEKKDMAYRGQ